VAQQPRNTVTATIGLSTIVGACNDKVHMRNKAIKQCRRLASYPPAQTRNGTGRIVCFGGLALASLAKRGDEIILKLAL